MPFGTAEKASPSAAVRDGSKRPAERTCCSAESQQFSEPFWQPCWSPAIWSCLGNNPFQQATWPRASNIFSRTKPQIHTPFHLEADILTQRGWKQGLRESGVNQECRLLSALHPSTSFLPQLRSVGVRRVFLSTPLSLAQQFLPPSAAYCTPRHSLASCPVLRKPPGLPPKLQILPCSF